MTREWHLELRDDVYCEKGRRERQGTLVEWWKPLVCSGFATVCLAPKPPSSEIDVTLTDVKPKEGEGGWVEIRVQRQGYYRWWWEFTQGYHRFYNTSYGMYRGCEDILMSMYPNEWDRDDGKPGIKFLHEGKTEAESYTLWVRICNCYEEVRD